MFTVKDFDEMLHAIMTASRFILHSFELCTFRGKKVLSAMEQRSR